MWNSMAKFNLLNFKIAGNGNDVSLREDLTEDRLEQSGPLFNPYGRKGKYPDRHTTVQPFDHDPAGSNETGGVADLEQQYKEMEDDFGFPQPLYEELHPMTPPSSDPYLDTGENPNYGEGKDPAFGPAQRMADPRAKELDNTNSDKRLPNGGITPAKPTVRRIRSSNQTATNVFNNIRRLIDVSPLEKTYGHLTQKGCVL